MPDHDPNPIAMRAEIIGLSLTFACPACGVAIDDEVRAEADDFGGLAVPLEDRFDICSHCGQLLDFGAALTQEAA